MRFVKADSIVSCLHGNFCGLRVYLENLFFMLTSKRTWEIRVVILTILAQSCLVLIDLTFFRQNILENKTNLVCLKGVDWPVKLV